MSSLSARALIGARLCLAHSACSFTPKLPAHASTRAAHLLAVTAANQSGTGTRQVAKAFVPFGSLQLSLTQLHRWARSAPGPINKRSTHIATPHRQTSTTSDASPDQTQTNMKQSEQKTDPTSRSASQSTPLPSPWAASALHDSPQSTLLSAESHSSSEQGLSDDDCDSALFDSADSHDASLAPSSPSASASRRMQLHRNSASHLVEFTVTHVSKEHVHCHVEAVERIADKMNLSVGRVLGLPTKRKLWTLVRSAFVHKSSRVQYELRRYGRRLVFRPQNQFDRQQLLQFQHRVGHLVGGVMRSTQRFEPGQPIRSMAFEDVHSPDQKGNISTQVFHAQQNKRQT